MLSVYLPVLCLLAGMDKVTVRKPRHEDKEAVLKINSNVFDGRDYLPAYFDNFMASNDMEAAVLIYEDKIVRQYWGQ